LPLVARTFYLRLEAWKCVPEKSLYYATAQRYIGFNIYGREWDKWAEGIPYLEEAYRIAPHDPKVLEDIGRAYLKVGKVDEGIALLKQADTDVARKALAEIDQYQIQLLSKKGVDYTRLRELLAAGKWKEADLETFDVILKAAGCEKEGYLEILDIKKFPCTDLRTIDQLWVKYSSGRFGFSVQKHIWQEVGGKEDYETLEKLSERVGWIKGGFWLDYSDMTFSTQAPVGHLPVGGMWLNWQIIFSLAQRLLDFSI